MIDSALIPKIIPALRRLRLHYQNKEEHGLVSLIEASNIYIEPETAYDNWNGGIDGHDVFLFVPFEMMGLLDLDNEDAIFQRIKEDLGKATPEIQGEFISSLYIKANDSSDHKSQAAIPFTAKPRATPSSTGLWRENALRLFISHRDTHKALANELAESLGPFGVSAFVAHDAIKPMKKWRNEILNGLLTMEVMLVLLTDDCHESVWTNQEIGFALGKGIPIIVLKVGATDPKGFIEEYQAQIVSNESMYDTAPLIQKTLINEIGQKGRLKEILIEAFIASTSYMDANASLERLTQTVDHLTDKEFLKIVKGYAENDQLHGCIMLHNRGNWFKRYLESATGKKLIFQTNKILEAPEDNSDIIPF